MGRREARLARAACLAVELITQIVAISCRQSDDVPLVNSSAHTQENTQELFAESDIQYLLFTKVNPVLPSVLRNGDASSLGHFDAAFPTVMVIHGFQSNQRTVMPIAEAYLGLQENMNVIVVNWTALATTSLLRAIEGSEAVAATTTRLIHFLATRGLDPRRLTLVGFSIGAHIAGLTAYRVNSVSVGKIVGLDPAGVFYYSKSKMKKLDRSDATFVQVVHTTANTIGYNGDLGHADFYFNGGTEPQPGCKLFTREAPAHISEPQNTTPSL
ncbi:lipase member H-A-like isoform X2 [Bacillus rossius redtenbacheri]|uniref:lipase member H-A-like isoform X2 n=1 Tax=Bacillus rossius redtenbacheri TaxID=93214 RepID=UPI002FDF098A